MPSIRKSWWAALTLAALVVGCTKEDATAPGPVNDPAPAPPGKLVPGPADKPAADPAPKPADADKPAADAPKAAAVKLDDTELAEIKKLPEDEQAVAIKQAVCPASGEHLGSMGTPIKVSAEGKTFYLCCKGCNADLKADPKSVVAKLAK